MMVVYWLLIILITLQLALSGWFNFSLLLFGLFSSESREAFDSASWFNVAFLLSQLLITLLALLYSWLVLWPEHPVWAILLLVASSIVRGTMNITRQLIYRIWLA